MEAGDPVLYDYCMNPKVNLKEIFMRMDMAREMTAEAIDKKIGGQAIPLRYEANHPKESMCFAQMMPPFAPPLLPYGRPQELGEKTDDGFSVPTISKTVILGAMPGVGKTQAAQVLPLMFNLPYRKLNTIEELENTVVESHSALCIDEYGLQDVATPNMAKLLLDREESTTVRVRFKNITIPQGVMMVITCNAKSLKQWVEDAFGPVCEEDMDAIERRCMFINCEYAFGTPEGAINYWWSRNAKHFRHVRPPHPNRPELKIKYYNFMSTRTKSKSTF